MLLVPRQLRRVGITGDVPYYGGRFTPEQAHAAAHPHAGRPGPRSTVPRFGPAPPAPPPFSAPARARSVPRRTDPLAALQDLLDGGVITRVEYDELRTRLSP